MAWIPDQIFKNEGTGNLFWTKTRKNVTSRNLVVVVVVVVVVMQRTGGRKPNFATK